MHFAHVLFRLEKIRVSESCLDLLLSQGESKINMQFIKKVKNDYQLE